MYCCIVVPMRCDVLLVNRYSCNELRRRPRAEWEDELSERLCLYLDDVVRAMFDRGRGGWRPLLKHGVLIGRVPVTASSSLFLG
jgi:hypothetical protein